MLQKLYEKHNKYLEIVTIIVDEDVELMKDFVNRSGYSWTFLHFDMQPEILQEYDVRTFPTYFLIDNQGKLAMSPAPSPAEEFEGRLFKELRAKGVL
jgi:thioredoxin-related protein